MKNFLKRLVGTVAPTVAAALGGPLAGTAVSAIASSLGIETQGKTQEDLEKEVYDSLQIATPDQLLQLKTLEKDFKVKLKELGIREEEVHQMDRQSARQREIQTGDKTNKYLALTLTVMLAGVLTALFWMANTEVTLDEAILSLLSLVLGVLIADHKQMISYYFGSSAGSARKQEILASERNQ